MMVGMQAQTVLQSMYLEGVQGQLQAQEDKKTKKRKTGKINMDGRAKILTQDDLERDDAKRDCQKLGWMKPKMPPMEKALRKPLLVDFAMQGLESDGDDEDDEDDDADVDHDL
jgi:hypothetical protein